MNLHESVQGHRALLEEEHAYTLVALNNVATMLLIEISSLRPLRRRTPKVTLHSLRPRTKGIWRWCGTSLVSVAATLVRSTLLALFSEQKVALSSIFSIWSIFPKIGVDLTFSLFFRN